jgi:hypothetical protein
VRTGPWLLGVSAPARKALKPAQVVVAGRPTLHRPVARLLADPDVAVHVLADARGLPWTDVAGTVRAIGSLPPLRPDPDWTGRWRAADDQASRALDEALDDPASPGGLRLARALVAALPAGAQLVLGSSNPVRDVALGAAPRRGLTVLANRGVAGIDGTVSTAVGAALVHDGPAYALLGDLTLLHDTSGLVIGPDEPRPDLTIVVLNDDGGGIFGLLEQGAPEHADAFERVFGTPHGVDLAALCAAARPPAPGCAPPSTPRWLPRAERRQASAGAPPSFSIAQIAQPCTASYWRAPNSAARYPKPSSPGGISGGAFSIILRSCAPSSAACSAIRRSSTSASAGSSAEIRNMRSTCSLRTFACRRGVSIQERSSA